MNLLVGSYIDPSVERTEELIRCLAMNYDSRLFSRIYVFIEEPYDAYREKIKSSKEDSLCLLWEILHAPLVVKLMLGRRATYGSFFRFANLELGRNVSVLGNSDIYFDRTLNQIAKVDMSNRLLAVSRREGGTLHEFPRGNDAWIFKSPFPTLEKDWNLGTVHSDHYVSFYARKAGVKVSNPCLSISCHHLHRSGVRRREESPGCKDDCFFPEWEKLEDIKK